MLDAIHGWRREVRPQTREEPAQLAGQQWWRGSRGSSSDGGGSTGGSGTGGGGGSGSACTSWCPVTYVKRSESDPYYHRPSKYQHWSKYNANAGGNLAVGARHGNDGSHALWTNTGGNIAKSISAVPSWPVWPQDEVAQGIDDTAEGISNIPFDPDAGLSELWDSGIPPCVAGKVWNHGRIGFGGCQIVCASGGFQGGNFSFSVDAIGVGGAVSTVGFATAKLEDQMPGYLAGCAVYRVGACATYGKTSDGDG